MTGVWFYDLQTENFHVPSGAVGSPAICGTRWGAATVAVYEEPPEDRRCEECFKDKKP